MKALQTNLDNQLKKVKRPKEFTNQIIQGDCLEVMKNMPANSIGLIVTSLPYNRGIR